MPVRLWLQPSNHTMCNCFNPCQSVPLRENTGKTRDRFTVSTYVTSSPDRFVSGLPCEVCFKGGLQIRAEVEELARSERGAAASAAGLQLTATTSAKGTYKEEGVLQFISRHCDQWVPGRRWRIFMLDSYCPIRPT